MLIPQEILNVLGAFSALFSKPVWNHALILTVGAILAVRQRTVTSCLRASGLRNEKRFCNFHRVLNRAKWNTLRGSKILLGLLNRLIPADAPLIIAVDETIERRNGPKIKAKGCYRDAVRSTKTKVVKCFGLKWISMALIAPLPWSKRPWALPFLTVLARSKACNDAEGRRHKTTVGWARQMIMAVRRWAPSRAIVLIGDGAYASVSLALCCAGFSRPVSLVSRMRTDARLYDFPPPEQSGKRGPKPKKGARLPSIKQRIADPLTRWTSIEVVWYDGKPRAFDAIWGVCLWHTPGFPPVPVKWVALRDPEGVLRTEAFFCTDLDAEPVRFIRWFILRWNIEVTFEELRTHLGLETQRQWSDKAVTRTTPCLFGLFSIIVLAAVEILKGKVMPVLTSAWYAKTEATFSDTIALVRRHIWNSNYVNSSRTGDFTDSDDSIFKILIDTVCYGS